jgi:hypothetical protein
MMKKIYYFLLTLFFQEVFSGNNPVVEQLLNAPSKQEARQIYRKVFNEGFRLGYSYKYLAWLGRLYQKSCQQIEDKKNDQAVTVMAQGLSRMFGEAQQAQSDRNNAIVLVPIRRRNDAGDQVLAPGIQRMLGGAQQTEANRNDTIGHVSAQDMQRRALLMVGPYWPIDNQTIERIITYRRFSTAARSS